MPGEPARPVAVVPTPDHVYLVRNTLIALIALVVNQTVAAAGGAVVTRLIGNPVLYGQVSVMQQILGITSLFLNVGLNSAVTFFVARHGRKAIPTVLGPALVGSLVAAAATAAVLAGLGPVFQRGYGIAGLAAALDVGSGVLLANAVVNVAIAVFSGMRDFRRQATVMVVATLLSTAGTTLGVVMALAQGGALAWINVGTASGAAVAAVWSLAWVAHRFQEPLLVRLRRPTFRRMLRYGLPNWAGNIAKSFQQAYLVVMTGAASVVDAGYLNNAVKLVGYVGAITWAFNIVGLPFLSQVIGSGERSRERATLAFRYNNFALFPLAVFIALAAPHVLAAFFGARYATGDAVAVTVLLTGGVLLSSVSRLAGTLLAGLGRPRANFWTMVVSGSVVFFVVPVVVAHHPLGALWAYIGGWALSAMSAVLFLARDGLALDWARAFLEPCYPAAAMGLLLLVGLHLPSTVWGLAVDCAAVLLAAGLTWWLEVRRLRLQEHGQWMPARS